jgi:hypothetical protein
MVEPLKKVLDMGLGPADKMQPVIEMTGAAVRAPWEKLTSK